MAGNEKPWETTVRANMEAPALDPMAAIQEELAALWCDLSTARNRAHHNRWSVECDWLAGRIVTLTRIAGATPWGDIQVDLLLDGTYTGILAAAGIPFEAPDLGKVRKLQEVLNDYGRV
jgi:hypothetical protein